MEHILEYNEFISIDEGHTRFSKKEEDLISIAIEKNPDLLTKVLDNKNLIVTLPDYMRVEKKSFGKPNKCETNTPDYIRKMIVEDNNKFCFPVGGFAFSGNAFHPVEHWWVYDSLRKKCFERPAG